MEAPKLPGLSPEERDQVRRLLSEPLEIPPALKAWLVSYLEANPPQLHIASMVGYAALEERVAALEQELGI